MPSIAPDSPPAARRSVRARLNYLGPSEGAPYIYYRVPPPGQAYTNMQDDPREVEITDLREDPSRLSLAGDGIAFLKHGSAFAEFDDEARLHSAYFPEVEQLACALLGVERAVTIDYAIRRRDHGPARPDGMPVAGNARRPIARVHGDFTPRSAPALVRRHMGAQADELLAGRYRILNFWRPIRGPLTDAPLALCHPGSVAAAHLAPIRQILEQHDNEIFGLRHDPAHRWLYLSAMHADEAVVFSSYDSARPCHAAVVAHSAFEDPTRPADFVSRESFEQRVLAFG